MKKFIIIYHAPADLVKNTGDKTPEEMREAMKPWMAWAQKCGDQLVDLGQPLTNGQKITPTGSEPSTRDVVGYSILQADSLDEAKALLKDHPHLKWDGACAIEVHETMPLPGSDQ